LLLTALPRPADPDAAGALASAGFVLRFSASLFLDGAAAGAEAVAELLDGLRAESAADFVVPFVDVVEAAPVSVGW
jgi:hypothetical protein